MPENRDVVNSIEQSINDLRTQIKHHDHLYHTLDAPEISDDAYNSLRRQLKLLEDANPQFKNEASPTSTASQKPDPSYEKVNHRKPMLSLDNAFSLDDVQKKLGDVLQRLPSSPLSGELKIDGLAVEVRYVNGILSQAVTRGDHYIGEDVTQAILTITDLPHKLLTSSPPSFMAIRGEVFMTKASFEKYNQWAKENNQKQLKNARNGAAGGVRTLDVSVTKARNLSFFAYSVSECEGVELPVSHTSRLAIIRQMGIPVSPWNELIYSISDIQKYWEKIWLSRDELPFDIDGTVFKVDDTSLQEMMGNSRLTPKWAVAYKFPSDEKTTCLEGVSFQVGRTGLITPVGHMTPTNIGGVTVSKANLCNRQQIEKLGIQIGDYIILARAGDVIPQVLSIDESKPRQGHTPIIYPENCPCCGTPLEVLNDGALTYCPAGFACDDQRLGRLSHFVDRERMNISGVASSTLDVLLKNGLIKTPADLFKLIDKRDQLLSIEGFAEKKVDAMLSSIEACKSVSLRKFIEALAIPEVGESTASDMALAFGSIENFMSATSDDFLKIPNVGRVTVESVTRFLTENKFMITELLNSGVHVAPVEIAADNYWNGRTVVITGSFTSWTRDELKSLLISKGAKIASSVSKKTSIVIVGADAGSKADVAASLGIEMISEDALQGLV